MRILERLKKFRDDCSGAMIIEFLMVVPPLVLVFFLSYVYFDAYRTKNTAQKATFSIADLLSRQTDAVDAEYLAGIKSVFDYLARVDSSEAGLRISSMSYDEEEDERAIVWSYAVGSVNDPLTTAELVSYQDKIPVIADDDTLILIESFISYSPPIEGLIGEQVFSTFTPVSPRFASQLAWAN